MWTLDSKPRDSLHCHPPCCLDGNLVKLCSNYYPETLASVPHSNANDNNSSISTSSQNIQGLPLHQASYIEHLFS